MNLFDAPKFGDAVSLFGSSDFDSPVARTPTAATKQISSNVDFTRDLRKRCRSADQKAFCPRTTDQSTRTGRVVLESLSHGAEARERPTQCLAVWFLLRGRVMVLRMEVSRTYPMCGAT